MGFPVLHETFDGVSAPSLPATMFDANLAYMVNSSSSFLSAPNCILNGSLDDTNLLNTANVDTNGGYISVGIYLKFTDPANYQVNLNARGNQAAKQADFLGVTLQMISGYLPNLGITVPSALKITGVTTPQTATIPALDVSHTYLLELRLISNSYECYLIDTTSGDFFYVTNGVGAFSALVYPPATFYGTDLLYPPVPGYCSFSLSSTVNGNPVFGDDFYIDAAIPQSDNPEVDLANAGDTFQLSVAGFTDPLHGYLGLVANTAVGTITPTTALLTAVGDGSSAYTIAGQRNLFQVIFGNLNVGRQVLPAHDLSGSFGSSSNVGRSGGLAGFGQGYHHDPKMEDNGYNRL